MSVLLISIAVVGATLIWPVNRWVMHNRGRPQVYGFWCSTVAALLSGCLAFIVGQSLFQPLVWVIGTVIGFAFAVGYCLIIMHCLRIGPVGPTVAMNNMGMLWPVLLGVLWLKPHPFNGWIVMGIALVCLSLFFFGVSKRGPKTAGSSSCWLLWALLGWALAGISMTAQLIGSIYASNSPFAIVCAFTTTAALILAPLVMRLRNTWFDRKEMLAGMANGVLLPVIGAATLTALNYAGPEVVFPFTVAGPLILVLILGRFLYHERLDGPAWLACFLGVAGLVGLSLGQAP